MNYTIIKLTITVVFLCITPPPGVSAAVTSKVTVGVVSLSNSAPGETLT